MREPILWCNGCDRVALSKAYLDDVLGYCQECLIQSQDRERLIDAAPELLEALKELVLRCDGPEGVRQDGSNIETLRAHAVLARVEGDDLW